MKNPVRRAEILARIDRVSHPLLAVQVGHLYSRLRMLEEQLRESEAWIDRQIQEEPAFQQMYDLLITIPGMGFVTSAALIAVVGHRIDRFTNVRQLVSYFGLCPRQRESGGKTIGSRSITKQGNSLIRGYLTQSAIGALRSHHPGAAPIREWYERIRRRKGWRIARVALARKMAAIAFGVLRTKQPYDPFRVNCKPISA